MNYLPRHESIGSLAWRSLSSGASIVLPLATLFFPRLSARAAFDELSGPPAERRWRWPSDPRSGQLPSRSELEMSQVAWKELELPDFSARQATNRNQEWDGSPRRRPRADAPFPPLIGDLRLSGAQESYATILVFRANSKWWGIFGSFEILRVSLVGSPTFSRRLVQLLRNGLGRLAAPKASSSAQSWRRALN
jgi:hypothetical protein